tara:strand:- start:3717 stop:3974 length:258 start_codon:yes stop_codon:yes gene_type:complete
MKPKTLKKKYKTTAKVCSYVMRKKMISGRALAKKLGVHYTTWHRYVRGERRPNLRIKAHLALLMGANNYVELIHMAYRKTHPSHT